MQPHFRPQPVPNKSMDTPFVNTEASVFLQKSLGSEETLRVESLVNACL